MVIEERGNCIFWWRRKITDWVYRVLLFCCLCSQDRSQILAFPRPAEHLTIIGETCIFLSIDSFLKSIHCWILVNYWCVDVHGRFL